MNEIKYVKVSPFYNGSGWYDSKSGIFFSKKNKEPIKLKEGIDLTSIRYYIRRNYLIDVTAEYDAETKKQKDQKYTMETQATNVSFKTLLKEEAYVEDVNDNKPVVEEVKVDTVEEVDSVASEEETAITDTDTSVEEIQEKATVKKSSNNKKKK